MSEKPQPFSFDDLKNKFPFETIHPAQNEVLKKICNSLNSGYKFIILEAATGFGKSAVAVSLARLLGSSYICSATKDLQNQYLRDFPFVKVVRGMSNFSCNVKEDFIRDNNNICGKCKSRCDSSDKSTSVTECRHAIAEYGPCRDEYSTYKHNKKSCSKCALKSDHTKFHEGCKYRTYLEDYEIKYQNTEYELIQISKTRKDEYEAGLKNNNDFWVHTRNFEDFSSLREGFHPCSYYDQLNKGLLASHTVFNYANFLTFLRFSFDLPHRRLLVLDEGHSIENNIVEQVGLSISKRELKKYMDATLLEECSYGYKDNIEISWVDFLIKLSDKLQKNLPSIEFEEARTNARDFLQRVNQLIIDIKSYPLNWIVSKIGSESGKVSEVEFKPLDISHYSRQLFDQCECVLIMSATILDPKIFCKYLGLDPWNVKFISVGSEFPVQNRPIFTINTATLNYVTLQLNHVQRRLSDAIDRIMTLHCKEKGIIHCTSYKQVRFIEKFVSSNNRKRLIATDPDKFNGREEILKQHFNTNEPTVLISPSLHTGLDLKDETSRFQIIVKVPYPNRDDRWIEAKRKSDQKWYDWQTSIRLVQAYGRSIRTKNDWAKTYVLDSGFRQFVTKNKLPEWYTEAIID